MLSNLRILITAFLLCTGYWLGAQPLLIDEGIQVEGLWCFPVYGESNAYRYLSPRARLALNQDSIPEFSFLRYVFEKPGTQPGTSTINEASGGGILHFLVLYDTPEGQVQKAQAALRKRLENKEIKIKGPIVFDHGRYALISSILKPDGKEETKLIGVGEAPVLENSKIALSFNVDPLHSKLLLESFKMATPDVSLVFEMGFSGVSQSYEAELEIDWDEVEKSQAFSAGGSIYFVSADVELGFDELRKNNAIKLTTVGSDEVMEGLLNTVYNKLLELMFEKVEPSSVPEAERGGLEDAIGALLGTNGVAGSRNTTGFGIGVGYKLKQRHTSGKARLTFHGRSTVNRKHYMTFNIGDLYKKYGDDERIFRDVPLWDPAFQQREVYVGIDGTLEREFDKMVNSVTVTLKKQHEDSSTMTTKQLLVNKKIFRDSLGKLSMIYLNHKDANRMDWLKYHYQAVWQFTGGGSYVTDWIKESASMINLYTPFRRRTIELEGDMEFLKTQGVRAVSVQINYPFFSEEKHERLTIRPGDNLADKKFEITLPINQDEVNYSITWIKSDGARPSTKGTDRFGLIFIDEMP